MPRSTVSQPTVGRPRKFDDGTERQLLIDAAIRVMEQNDYSDISVNELLAEAQLSTRAFYRHFESKEALLETFMLSEAESVARSLTRVVAAAPDPVTAIDMWLERFLDVFHEPRRAKRATLLASAAARSAGPSAALMIEMRAIVTASLVDALRSGHEAHLLFSPNPEADAYSIHSLVLAHRDAHRDGEHDRAETKAHVVRFGWAALQIDGR